MSPASFLFAYLKRTKGYEIHAIGEGEEHFSWSPCDTCGGKAGMRTDCVLTNPGKVHEGCQVQSCAYCVNYAANGTLPENTDDAQSH